MKAKNNFQSFFIKYILNFFASLNFSFFLFLMIILFSIIGTVIPQKREFQDYVKLYGKIGAKIVTTIDLNNVYSSTWFIFLLIILLSNLIICSIKRFPNDFKVIKCSSISEIKLSIIIDKEIILTGKLNEHLVLARNILKKIIGSVTELKLDNKLFLFAQNSKYLLLSIYVVHFSIFILFIGGIISNIWSFSGQVVINEGDIVDSVLLDDGSFIPLGFQLRLDKFNIFFYKDGMVPSEYRSNITFLKDSKEVTKASLIVNSPIKFNNIVFYQSFYGKIIKHAVVNIIRNGKIEHTVLKYGSWNKLPSGGRVIILDFYDRVCMNNFYCGPVIRICYEDYTGEKRILIAFKEGANKLTSYQGQLRVALIDIDSFYYTGLQVKYDPGILVIIVGFILMILGIGFSFFSFYRKIWICLVILDNNSVSWRIVGTSNKNRNKLHFLLRRIYNYAERFIF